MVSYLHGSIAMNELGVARQPTCDKIDQQIPDTGVDILTNSFFVKGQQPDDGEQDARDSLRAPLNNAPGLLSMLDEGPDLQLQVLDRGGKLLRCTLPREQRKLFGMGHEAPRHLTSFHLINDHVHKMRESLT